DIAEAVLAPRYLNATLSEMSADGAWFVHQVGDGPVPMVRFSRPFDELGGLFIDHAANRDRNLTIRSDVGIQVISAVNGRVVDVQVPGSARVSNATWSPSGARVAFFVHTDDATHIWVADAATGRSRQITRTPVLATTVTEFQWTSDGREIATVLIPSARSRRPLPSAVPMGPQVKATEEGENMLRTYASLMATPYDEELLEWHATGQLALVDVESRQERKVGDPTMIWAFDFAPDGAYARVTRMVKPFSYVVPTANFGKEDEIWSRDGTMVRAFDSTPLNTGLQGANVAAPGASAGADDNDGPRQAAWRKDGKGLTFLESAPAPEGQDEAPAAEGEDGPARRKDRVMSWLPPFDSAGLSVVYENPRRIATYAYSPDHGTVFLSERQGRNTHQFAVILDDPGTRYTLARYETENVYASPGALLPADGSVPATGRFQRGRSGGGTVQVSADGAHAFFTGVEYDTDPLTNGPKSFVDRVEIRTGEKERIFEGSNDGVWERITAVLDVEAGDLVLARQSPTEVEQSFHVTGRGETQLTRNVDYTPDLTAAPRERFVVERPDGFRFMVNVTLPPGHDGSRLPAMFWFYPREYEDQESYDDSARTWNKNAFPNFGTRSMQYLVRLGYAVVEPDAPIVGKAGQMNNNYEHDLRNNLAAVIDELDRRGIVDRQRLGLGGHSYGAFSTVNAMVHTPFFKAGIAGDGNYNRTFTPLMFQSERRVFWDAKDTYLSMSPFMYANNLTGALLMYHGLHDQNVGTDPDHSPRLFHALNGLGKTAAMYLYPYEDHGPASRETLLDLWARWTAWLEVHLKSTDQPIISQE
ncbi:MAG: prolyl oligopeptidase family serine peptidase, partial [Gemmatimonadota bacterium]|nr:prolyl oligopeptidase family serine peptidase [Gemmatimonadota bacterium]